jgi:phosphatidylserine/phosphatidylglycerophosphate/cardiolipin synthase-like enzyme
MDWRGDDDERLGPDGPRLGDLLSGLAGRGVEVRGLLWRSHPKLLGFNEEDESVLASVVNKAGGQLLLDGRVRRFGSHHQKLVVLLHPGRPQDDVAFVGGIDLCHGRRDDARHHGDPQAERLDPAYGTRPPWHDIQASVRGPAIADLVETFRERWEDRTPLGSTSSPLRRILHRWTHEPATPDPLPPFGPSPPATGTQAVQVLRTYPVKRPAYPFAVDGERSIARMYAKALPRARSLVYVEDQYFWSEEIATLYEEALRRAPELRLIAVVPRHPDRNGALSGPASRLGQLAMMDRLAAVGGDRVAFFDLENERGDAIYVHAKVVIIDDVIAMVGSDNMNLRSWTHDSELSIAVLDEEPDEREPSDPAGRGDGARRFARELRLRLWGEHLGTGDDGRLNDPIGGLRLWVDTAAALDAWHESGGRGPRPPGRIRRHHVRPLTAWQRVIAKPLYRAVIDPDGRPSALRRSRRF